MNDIQEVDQLIERVRHFHSATNNENADDVNQVNIEDALDDMLGMVFVDRIIDSKRQELLKLLIEHVVPRDMLLTLLEQVSSRIAYIDQCNESETQYDDVFESTLVILSGLVRLIERAPTARQRTSMLKSVLHLGVSLVRVLVDNHSDDQSNDQSLANQSDLSNPALSDQSIHQSNKLTDDYADRIWSTIVPVLDSNDPACVACALSILELVVMHHPLPTNQSTSRSTDHSNTQSNTQSNNQSINQSIDQSIIQSNSQTSQSNISLATLSIVVRAIAFIASSSLTSLPKLSSLIRTRHTLSARLAELQADQWTLTEEEESLVDDQVTESDDEDYLNEISNDKKERQMIRDIKSELAELAPFTTRSLAVYIAMLQSSDQHSIIESYLAPALISTWSDCLILCESLMSSVTLQSHSTIVMLLTTFLTAMVPGTFETTSQNNQSLDQSNNQSHNQSNNQIDDSIASFLDLVCSLIIATRQNATLLNLAIRAFKPSSSHRWRVILHLVLTPSFADSISALALVHVEDELQSGYVDQDLMLLPLLETTMLHLERVDVATAAVNVARYAAISNYVDANNKNAIKVIATRALTKLQSIDRRDLQDELLMDLTQRLIENCQTD